jgi:biopolymer transport protein ExbD
VNTAHAWRRRDARSEYERHHHGPNMTPMVDVVMVILIFFMASTVILGPEMLLAAGLEPDADATPADPRFAIESPVFEIRVAPGAGSIAITGLGLTDASLDRLNDAARALAAEADPSRVRMVLTPDDATPYEAVIRVQDILRDAGFRSIGLR